MESKSPIISNAALAGLTICCSVEVRMRGGLACNGDSKPEILGPEDEPVLATGPGPRVTLVPQVDLSEDWALMFGEDNVEEFGYEYCWLISR